MDHPYPVLQDLIDALERGDTVEHLIGPRLLAQKAEIEGLRAASAIAQDILSKWLAHMYSHQQQFIVLREARDALRAANEQPTRKTYTAGNNEELPEDSPGTTIVNDGRPT